MTKKIIHFNQAAQINQLLKEKGIEYSLHLHGGCEYCVPELRQDGVEYSLVSIYEIINEYLKPYFIQVKPDDLNPHNVVVY